MSGLQFQDFNVVVPPESVNSTNNDSRTPAQTGDRAQLFNAGAEAEGERARKANFFTFEFYQQYFDVDTDQVTSRILNSMVPRFRTNFITDHIQPIPDLYGPFWICVTLVFTTAICGNFAKYVETNGDIKNHEYGSDFRLVTGASTLIASYVILIPFALYTLFWYRRSVLQYSYLEILCAYGYSLSIFVPVSMLWVIHAQWFRWFLIVVSVMLSGTVLVGSIWPAIRNDPNKAIAFGTIVVVMGLHAFLAIGFKEFYFDASQPLKPKHSNELTTSEHQIASGAKIVEQTKESKISTTAKQSVINESGGGLNDRANSSKRAIPQAMIMNAAGNNAHEVNNKNTIEKSGNVKEDTNKSANDHNNISLHAKLIKISSTISSI